MAEVGVNVRFQGKVLLIELGGGGPMVQQLEQRLEEKTGVPVEAQKLVAKGGKALKQHGEAVAEKTLASLVQPVAVLGRSKAAQLQLIGTSPKDREDFQALANATQAAAERLVVNDMDVDYDVVTQERKTKSAQAEKEKRLREANSSEYRFYEIRALPQFADYEKAEAILFDLSTDPGFLALMRKHKWKVGVLSEMYPEGKVGVDPVCVLGLNVNRG
jgi:hypothetical protein